MKRVSIAAEVVALPSLLFLDEPTTYLDAEHSFLVIRMLRILARGREGGREGGWKGGMSIVASIHQPSRELFAQFDSLLVLGRGGQLVYVGPAQGTDGVVAYLDSIPGVPPVEAGENPASWVLRCVQPEAWLAREGPRAAGTRQGDAPIDFPGWYARSAWHDTMRRRVREAQRAWQRSETATEPLTDKGSGRLARQETDPKGRPRGATWRTCFPPSLPPSLPPSFCTQLHVCTRRAWSTCWRLPSYQWSRIGGTAAMALVLSGIYHGQPQETVPDLVGYLGLIFLSLTFTACINSTAVLELMHQERPAFYRERFAGAYGVPAYALSWLLVEVPYVGVQSVLFLLFLYFPLGFSTAAWRVAWFWAFLFLYMLFATAFGQALAALTPSTQTAQTLFNTIAPIFSIMSGMTFMPGDVPRGWIPLWVLCPLNKAFEGMVMTQWWTEGGGEEGGEATIVVFNPATRTFEKASKWGVIQWFFGGKDEGGGIFRFSFVHRWRNLCLMVVFILACNVLLMAALQWRRFERR